MARVVAEAAEVNARIVYWGVEDAGQRECLEAVSSRLRPDHRGELQEVPTRLDPSVSYAVLPIELGAIGGMRTRIQLVAVPGGDDQAPTRLQLLDEVDGVVLVVDAQKSRLEENAARVDELRKALADYGLRLEDLPLVVQYHKRDLSDAYVIDELHRRLGLGNATVFETASGDADGALQALSTISKKVIRVLRDTSLGGGVAAASVSPAPPREAPQEPPVSEPAPVEALEAESEPEALEAEPVLAPVAPSEAAAQLEEAILAEEEAEGLEEPSSDFLDQPWHHEADALEAPLGARVAPGLSIVSVGEATRADARTVRVPLVLGDAEGETSTLVLSVRLDPLLDDG